jgi:hypothetical protein
VIYEFNDICLCQTPTGIGQQARLQSEVSVLYIYECISRGWNTNGPVAISFVGVNKIVNLTYAISTPL